MSGRNGDAPRSVFLHSCLSVQYSTGLQRCSEQEPPAFRWEHWLQEPHHNALQRTPSTTTRYGEHPTRRPPMIMRYLIDASLKQVPAQGSAQSGDDDQEVMNQQRGPATQQERSTRRTIQYPITHPLWHHNTRSLERWGDTTRTPSLAARLRCLLTREASYITLLLYLMADQKNRSVTRQ